MLASGRRLLAQYFYALMSLLIAGVVIVGFGATIDARLLHAPSPRPAIVYLHATWCPTCKIQTPIVERLSTDPKLKSVTIFLADYDTEVALKKSLKVTQQSTFVVFKQGHEVTRSTGQTQEQAIRATFEQAL